MLPGNATNIKPSHTGNINGSNTPAQHTAGGVESFQIGDKTFTARYNSKTGDFARYGFTNTDGSTEEYNYDNYKPSYWKTYKELLKFNSGIQEFDVYGSVQLKFTWNRGNIFKDGDNSKLVVPYGLQGGYNTEQGGGYWDAIGPKNSYFNYGYLIADGRISKGESSRGDYAKARGLLTVYNAKGIKLQLDAVGNINDPSTLRIGARAVYEKVLFQSNTVLAPTTSVEGAAGFRVKYQKPWWFVGLMPIRGIW
jgi:hypothetical protein